MDHIMRGIVVMFITIVLVGCGNGSGATAKGTSSAPTTPTGRTITAATPELGMQQANAGDIVSVTGTFTVTNSIYVKQGVTLEGNGTTVLNPDPAVTVGDPLVWLEDDATIRGCTITGLPKVYRYSVGSNGALRPKTENCILDSVVYGYCTDGVIRSNVFPLTRNALGAVALHQSLRPVVTNNTFYQSHTGISLFDTTDYVITENIIYEASIGISINVPTLRGTTSYNNNAAIAPYVVGAAGTFTPLPGTNEIALDPRFVNYDSDFRLAPGSPCRTNGKTGGPIGALPAVTYKTTCTISLDPTSPSRTIPIFSYHTTLYVFRITAGASGPVTLNIGDIIELWRSPQSSGTTIGTPLLWESGTTKGTATVNNAQLSLFSLIEKVIVSAGTFRTFTITGDTPQFVQGATLQLSVPRVTWSDGVIQRIDDRVTPTGMPAQGGVLTFY
ncbi:right-handed parallel beta-helix repeat-containing protein [Candidatus Uhrbacteria bacterium]|nr:right-handed parallel beta-helix repeat-containing protein [Candidatus Uhrbacteria bacterium]